MATFKDLMDGFGVVTVMNACLYKLKAKKQYVGRSACAHTASTGGALTPNDFDCTGLYLDTLKIANFTQEGPTKTVTGGQYANPLIKYGKTMTCEMQDALGRAATMVEFFGCDYDQESGRLSVTDKFPGAFALEGETFFIDQTTGEKVPVYIFIPQFLPDAILTLTQDAEGDATVFDLNGTVAVTKIADSANGNARDIFYEIRSTSWFSQANGGKAERVVDDAATHAVEWDWHNPATAPTTEVLVGTPTISVANRKVTATTVNGATGYEFNFVHANGEIVVRQAGAEYTVDGVETGKVRVRAYKTQKTDTVYGAYSEWKDVPHSGS